MAKEKKPITKAVPGVGIAIAIETAIAIANGTAVVAKCAPSCADRLSVGTLVGGPSCL